MALRHSLFMAGVACVVLAGASARAVIIEQERRTPAYDFTTLAAKTYQGTVIVSADGLMQERFSDRSFTQARSQDIPRLLKLAFEAAEDRNFEHHHGIDIMALVRAGVTDIVTHRHIGASTITQQVVKNLITGDNVSLGRKIREAVLATRMERILSKDDILTLYLNAIYFGKGAYGVSAAAHVWFNSDMDSLTLGQIAFLAALPKGPSVVDPALHPARARARRSYVLDNMVRMGSITRAQADEANREPLPQPDAIRYGRTGETYYSEWVRRLLLRRGDVYHTTALVRTWQSARLQKVSDQALQHGLIAYDERHGWPSQTQWGDAPPQWVPVTVMRCGKGCLVQYSDGHTGLLAYRYSGTPTAGQKAYDVNGVLQSLPRVNGAVVVMDYKGHVLAQSGGFWRGASSFDRSMQSVRQIGSTIKPFIACKAVDQGWTPDTIIADVPIDVDGWKPGGDGHDEGAGLIPLKTALALSRNQGFVRLGMELGYPQTYDEFVRFGLYNDTSGLTPSSTLGAAGTTVMRLTAAYASLASGHIVSPSWVQSDDVQGEAVTCSNAVTQMLHGVTEIGTAKAVFSGMPDIAGKTGTSNQVMDGWFVGYDGKIVVGVHVGYDQPQPLGDSEFGSTLAAPIAADIFRADAVNGATD